MVYFKVQNLSKLVLADQSPVRVVELPQVVSLQKSIEPLWIREWTVRMLYSTKSFQ